MAKSISLKPKRELLNPNFDGYKLSLDGDVTVYSQNVNEALEPKKSNTSCYLRTRIEALHNHLFKDPFHVNHVYYFTSRGHLIKHQYSKDSKLSSSEVVWQADMSELSEEESEGDRYFASLHFPSEDLAVVTNGRGSLHILETGDRMTTQSWLECLQTNTERGVIMQSYIADGEDYQRHLHCLIVSVTTQQELINNEQYVIVDEGLKNAKDVAVHLINWLVITYNGATWEPGRVRRLAGRGTIEYCSFDTTASGLIILCHSNYSFVEDSMSPITVPKPKEKVEEKKSPKYTYMQNDEDLIVYLNVGQITREDLKVKAQPKELCVKIKDSIVLEGQFTDLVSADMVTWTIRETTLELTLPKASEGVRWKQLLEGDDVSGEEVFDPQLIEEVNQRLAHLTSDKLDDNPDLDKPAYNPEQLEACDEAQEDLLLLHLDGSTHKTDSLGQLGATQHLFNSQVQGSAIPAFCIRSDVDGILWLPEKDSYTHVATFNAFGYVKASKTMAKFTCASADNSYVAIADVKSHIYVFFQSEAYSGELRNRKSGKRMNTVARQLVISMKTHDEILGLHCDTDVLFVLTEKTLYAYALRS